MGESFNKKGLVYIKMVSSDGYETNPEKIGIMLSSVGFDSVIEEEGISLSDSMGESDVKDDSIPFMNNDKVAFDIENLKTSISRKRTKIRIMLGPKGESPNLLGEDEAWENWKKFCKMQPVDLSLSQWKNVADSAMKTNWTSSVKVEATGYGWLEGDLSNSQYLADGIQVTIDGGVGFN